MNSQRTFTHSTGKTEYIVKLDCSSNSLKIQLDEKLSVDNWSATFDSQYIETEISRKTGHPLPFGRFIQLLVAAFEKKEDFCYVDILTSTDLENLRAKKGQRKENTPSTATKPKSNKRYIILTHMANDQRVHYPLPLAVFHSENDADKLKAIYKQLREELDNQRLKVMNDTSKSEQSSFSINYEKKGSRNHDTSHLKEIDQLKSENEILKSKLKRLQEQAQKKMGSDMDAIVERKNELQLQLESPNMKLVDIRFAVEQQQENYTMYKQELIRLHKQISQLLTTDKELKVKKHAEEVEKELELTRKNVNKNTQEVDRLKQQLQKGKQKNRQLEQRAKKLNTEKDVIKRGRRGPYSSYSGSVKSGSSRASSFNGSVSSKRSGYSYNSAKYRR